MNVFKNIGVVYPLHVVIQNAPVIPHHIVNIWKIKLLEMKSFAIFTQRYWLYG